MMLSDGTTSLYITDEIPKVDEYWQPVVQSVSWTIDGHQRIDAGVKQAGEPLTFASDGESAIVERRVVDQLHRWASVPDIALKLTRFDEEIDVTFRHDDGAAVTAKPLKWIARKPRPDDLMVLTFRLVVI